ncbi:hypothetical protein CH333_09580 [candidate division WOR-3 bacterium JGI_Cruoil_03_44_89]|uniref:Polymerase nucleotidyl transferase domain-containing protein n=1 Tax=candidate division WOR-3 bacterium JGI_Cruoil_03_44_89 TaxID=1973748 RepID=A0A235BNM0_UNCW3|nr:MAG: hypothetical protein CH333_09580 [candidate division WOR-3 bacterium JGI_Cruoil_03_44_89]
MDKAKIETILKELKERLTEIYGEDLIEIVLYGSYARGEASEDSDIDIFVLLKKVKNPFKERQKFAQIVWELSLKNDIVISALPVEYEQFQNKSLPIFCQAREEGVMI